MSVFGLCPIAINTPFSSMSLVELSFTFLMRMPVTPVSSPKTSSRVLNVSNMILPSATRAINLSTKIASALNLSRRCTKVTLLAILARYRASSTAVLPPPITATSWFL